MASSVTTSMAEQLRDAADKLGFDDIRVVEAIGHTGYRIEAFHGNQCHTFQIMDRNPRAWVTTLQDISRKIDHDDRTNLDIRHNAVESFDDYMTLLHKAREQNRRINTVWITPEQKHTIIADPELEMTIPIKAHEPIRVLGCLLRVESV